MSNAFVGRQLPVIPLTAAGTFYTPWMQFTRQEHIGFQFDAVKVGGVSATIGFDFKSHALADPCAYEVSGSVVAIAVESAGGVITGSVGKLTFASISPSSSGNEITIILADDAGTSAGGEVASLVETNTMYENLYKISQRVITVLIESGVSTAAQIKAAIEADAACDALITATVTDAGAMESAVVSLTDGSKFFDFITAAPQVRGKIVVTTGAAGAYLQPYAVGKE